MKTPDELIEEILASRKYRDLGIPPETVRDLMERELAVGRSQKEAAKGVRQKMHNIMAPYLGDPDYSEAARRLDEANGDNEQVRAICADLLAQHASTHERLPLLTEFYAAIFEVTGAPRSILDLACALNPFAFPWMGLPAAVQYHAYDIHAPRVALINHFFALQGLEPLAEVRDILVSPPDLPADAAFFFKEAHRFEQRQKSSTRQFLAALRAHWLVITLPASSLTGRHNLAEGHRRLVYNAVEGRPVIERRVGEELIFIVENPV